jgi:hypothetical protein
MNITDEQYQTLLTELKQIREALTASRSATPAPAASRTLTGKTGEDIPQPTFAIDNPELVTVHFGKNAGVEIGKLAEKSLGWYCLEPEPRIGNNGKPFPPREADVNLRNAARLLWHSRRGTLTMASLFVSQPKPTAPTEAQVDAEFTDSVPF